MAPRSPCAAFSNWAADFFVSYYFLQLIDAIGKAWTFWMYGGLAVAGVAFFVIKVPETKNRALEQIEHDLCAYTPRANTRRRTA